MLGRLLLTVLCLASPLRAQERPPNIVLLYADDHAQAAVGCYGSVLCETPNIDALATRGTRFTRSFVTNSICGPARAVLLTGVHNHVNGKIHNQAGFDDTLPSLPALLQEAGYATAVFGKWHLPTDPRGFDDWTLVQGSYYGPNLRSAEGSVRGEGHSTDLITGMSSEWLAAREEDDRPFFLWVSYKATHRTWEPGPEQLGLYRGVTLPEPATLFDDYAGRSPGAAATQMRIARDLFPAYDLKLPATGEGILDQNAQAQRDRMPADVRERWESLYGPENEAFLAANLEGEELVRWKYQRYIQDYLRCVAGIDASVGRLLAQLEAQGQLENTLVVFTSDQGFFLGEHGWYDKRWMYEPAFATPMIAAGPGVAQGAEVEALVQNLDLAPTLLEVGGVAAPESMQGLDLGPLLAGEEVEAWRDAVYYHYLQRDSGRTSHTVAPHYGVRTERHKLLYVYDHDTWELYDLVEDPDEMHNLAGQEAHAELQARLTAKLHELREQYSDTLGEAR